jgi:adenine deaminase
MGSQPSFRDTLRRRLDAALGRRDCDLVIDNARWLDVFSARFREGPVAIDDGVIVGLEPGRRARRVIDARGKWLVPGFIDAHVHVESSMMLPEAFSSAVLPHGTTSAVCDPHELANVVGPRGIQYFLEAAERVPVDLWVMMSSCVPATLLETNGGGIIDAAALGALARHPRALGLAEVMSYSAVLAGEAGVLDKLEAFADRPIDGHAPLVLGGNLSAYAAVGVASCHESSRLDEAQEKLTRGMAVWIREGSVAKDVRALAPLLSLATSTSVGFCTDDRNPYDLAHEGHLDHVIRTALALGVAPEVAYRAASWTVARHYGLERGRRRVGAIAPGFAANLVLLDDVQSCAVALVLKDGVPVSELDAPALVDASDLTGTVRAGVPLAADLVAASGQVHVIGVEHGKLLTGRRVASSDAPGVRRLSVLERHGHRHRPASAYVEGFGELRGAIASSVGHDSHNLIVVGDRPEDMRVALARLIELGGGFAVVSDGEVRASMALPYGGLMSAAPPRELALGIAALKEASRAIGCVLPEPFLQLAFLSLPVIPTLKLTDRGLVDTARQELIPVLAA